MGTMAGGRLKLISLVFATYISLFINQILLRYMDVYEIASHPYRNIAVFTVLLLITFFLLYRKVLSGVPKTAFKWWQALLISFVTVGLFVAGALQILSFPRTIEFSDLTRSLFVGKAAYLFWSLAPLAGFFVISKGK